MIVIYLDCIFFAHLSNKLGSRSGREVKFLEYIGDQNKKEVIDKYRSLHPNTSVREFGVGQGVPTFIISSVRQEKSHKLVLSAMCREESIDGLLD